MNLLKWLRRERPIVVVSGLPRSGTSMAMQMLEAGGLPVLADAVRQPDESNPKGYFELEGVKRLHEDAGALWLAQAPGHAVKIVSPLLTWLPETHAYRVVFMRRDLREIVRSQIELLAARGESSSAEDPARMMAAYTEHLAQVARFLTRRSCFTTLDVEYARVLQDPLREARRLSTFLGGRLDPGKMAAIVDARLYRQREGEAPAGTSAGT
jgi:hypothetical protein